MKTPPEDHPLPTKWIPGGWIWSPEAGEYVPALSQPEPIALLAPADTTTTEETTNGEG